MHPTPLHLALAICALPGAEVLAQGLIDPPYSTQVRVRSASPWVLRSSIEDQLVKFNGLSFTHNPERGFYAAVVENQAKQAKVALIWQTGGVVSRSQVLDAWSAPSSFVQSSAAGDVLVYQSDAGIMCSTWAKKGGEFSAPCAVAGLEGELLDPCVGRIGQQTVLFFVRGNDVWQAPLLGREAGEPSRQYQAQEGEECRHPSVVVDRDRQVVGLVFSRRSGGVSEVCYTIPRAGDSATPQPARVVFRSTMAVAPVACTGGTLQMLDVVEGRVLGTVEADLLVLGARRLDDDRGLRFTVLGPSRIGDERRYIAKLFLVPDLPMDPDGDPPVLPPAPPLPPPSPCEPPCHEPAIANLLDAGAILMDTLTIDPTYGDVAKDVIDPDTLAKLDAQTHYIVGIVIDSISNQGVLTQPIRWP